MRLVLPASCGPHQRDQVAVLRTKNQFRLRRGKRVSVRQADARCNSHYSFAIGRLDDDKCFAVVWTAGRVRDAFHALRINGDVAFRVAASDYEIRGAVDCHCGHPSRTSKSSRNALWASFSAGSSCLWARPVTEFQPMVQPSWPSISSRRRTASRMGVVAGDTLGWVRVRQELLQQRHRQSVHGCFDRRHCVLFYALRG
jgi:hypothetical protein